MLATGARVRNAYATYLQPEDNPEKFGLILHMVTFPHEEVTKEPWLKMGMRDIR